ncbi:hypothetical protein A4G19_13895 [Pasteurellaceae bacterium Macca]|nr:hypothetical protein [Pasteurellaceae bacterium Macca]MCK3656771.1 hypothetical protein [Pasteurellaceae bacterium Macca]
MPGRVIPQNTVLATLSAERAERAESMIDEVFEELKATFPAWKHAFETLAEFERAKQIWLEKLVEERITPTQLRGGLNKAKNATDPFLPSVGKFISWCKGSDYHAHGLPEPAEVPGLLARFRIREFKPMDYRSNAEYWLLSGLEQGQKRGFWKPERLEKEIASALDAMLDKIKSGVIYAPPETAELPKSVRVRLTPEQRKAAFNRHFGRFLRGKNANPND